MIIQANGQTRQLGLVSLGAISEAINGLIDSINFQAYVAGKAQTLTAIYSEQAQKLGVPYNYVASQIVGFPLSGAVVFVERTPRNGKEIIPLDQLWREMSKENKNFISEKASELKAILDELNSFKN